MKRLLVFCLMLVGGFVFASERKSGRDVYKALVSNGAKVHVKTSGTGESGPYGYTHVTGMNDGRLTRCIYEFGNGESPDNMDREENVVCTPVEEKSTPTHTRSRKSSELNCKPGTLVYSKEAVVQFGQGDPTHWIPCFDPIATHKRQP